MRLFTEHPGSVGETYLEHLQVAWSFGFPLVRAGIGCIVHGLLPFLCSNTGSKTILAQHARLIAARGRNDTGPQFDWCI
ncbi:DUF6356 family protein [Erythrobacter litoralis]|uniref:Capsule biosynthesis protein n=1 Tax=Erythrobacter litoralis (strain HTCC2594) TaxID=314225 RepID=Q2N8B0_ERYLH|nr:DUF6356 family protein [Erythrobacter litoralis]ABC64081.1 hypothetical protein ELI_09945 [Erythrobacter litoralis HTCC2594]